MAKRTLWLLLSNITHADVPLVAPTLAWMAHDVGAQFECYLEAERNGRLFARTGSTVLGGAHHQQFNYLHAVFDVKVILLGPTALFRSSIDVFDTPILAQADTAVELYRALLANTPTLKPAAALLAPSAPLAIADRALEISPYLFPEVYYRKALGLGSPWDEATLRLLQDQPIETVHHLYLSPEEKQELGAWFEHVVEVDQVREGDGYGTLTLRIAERWKHAAKGLAFGDPAAILSQIASHCRQARIAVFGSKKRLSPADVVVSAYTEEQTEIAADVIRLAKEVDNRVLVGRQTGDGDLFAWSRGGVCIQIMDPNRPAFPVVETTRHVWADVGADVYADEPDDETLLAFAREGKILATLLWHSGEMAHNEAMLNLFEMATFTGIKMGIGVHAARYETSPQLWELLQIPRSKGGVLGLIEPVLHSGGMGVLAENNCPPEMLREHCETALARIRKLAGDGSTPKGYYAFLDAADLATLAPGDPAVYEAIEASGLEYVVSSALPGRNQILHQTERCVVFNQSCRVVHSASPFVRITTVDDLETASRIRPGWLVGTLDAPVIAFNPYIWRHGTRFMQLVDRLLQDKSLVNVLPHTIARYARLLQTHGFLPPPLRPQSPAQAGTRGYPRSRPEANA